MSWREWADSILAAGLGPEDIDDEPGEMPSEVIVNVIKPERCQDYYSGEIEFHEVRTYRAFPLFMAKAAFRWAAYWERKHGKANVWIEYE